MDHHELNVVVVKGNSLKPLDWQRSAAKGVMDGAEGVAVTSPLLIIPPKFQGACVGYDQKLSGVLE